MLQLLVGLLVVLEAVFVRCECLPRSFLSVFELIGTFFSCVPGGVDFGDVLPSDFDEFFGEGGLGTCPAGSASICIPSPGRIRGAGV